MASEIPAPRDAKVASIILRSLGIEECEPVVIVQLLEFAYHYSCDILKDARIYATSCGRENIAVKDVKLALQAKVGRHFLPAPPRDFLQEQMAVVNARPLSQPDGDNLIRVPGLTTGLYSMEYTLEQQETNSKRRKVH